MVVHIWSLTFLCLLDIFCLYIYIFLNLCAFNLRSRTEQTQIACILIIILSFLWPVHLDSFLAFHFFLHRDRDVPSFCFLFFFIYINNYSFAIQHGIWQYWFKMKTLPPPPPPPPTTQKKGSFGDRGIHTQCRQALPMCMFTILLLTHWLNIVTNPVF